MKGQWGNLRIKEEDLPIANTPGVFEDSWVTLDQLVPAAYRIRTTINPDEVPDEDKQPNDLESSEQNRGADGP